MTLVGLLVGATPQVAAAQAAEAETLFQEARRLLKDGKVAEACDKLDASERLESSIGTLLNLADCREKNNQLATAWATFLKAAAASKRAGHDAQRETEARRRARLLEARLSYLTISVPEASVVDGLVVSRNGAEIDRGLWNQGVPVDAGTYQITGQAPGHEAWSTQVAIDQEGEKISVEVPRFKELEALVNTAPPVAPAPAPHDDDDQDVAPAPAPRRMTGLRGVSIGVAVVGLAAIGGGVAFGVKARRLAADADRLCPTAMCSDPVGVQRNDDARDAALRANVLLGVGGVAVAGAVVLWLIGGPDQVTPVVDDEQIGLAFAGRF